MVTWTESQDLHSGSVAYYSLNLLTILKYPLPGTGKSSQDVRLVNMPFDRPQNVEIKAGHEGVVYLVLDYPRLALNAL